MWMSHGGSMKIESLLHLFCCLCCEVDNVSILKHVWDWRLGKSHEKWKAIVSQKNWHGSAIADESNSSWKQEDACHRKGTEFWTAIHKPGRVYISQDNPAPKKMLSMGVYASKKYLSFFINKSWTPTRTQQRMISAAESQSAECPNQAVALLLWRERATHKHGSPVPLARLVADRLSN